MAVKDHLHIRRSPHIPSHRIIVIWVYAPMLLFRIKIMLKPIIDGIRYNFQRRNSSDHSDFLSQPHSSGRVRKATPNLE